MTAKENILLEPIRGGFRSVLVFIIATLVFTILSYFKTWTATATIPTPLDVNVTGQVSIDDSTPINVSVTGEVTAKSTVDKYEDAFSRLRTSEVYTLGDYKHTYFEDKSYITHLEGAAFSMYSQNEAAVYLHTTGVGAQRCVHQSKAYHHYQPGKSQLIFGTFVFGSAQSGNIKRTGYFDDLDGIFLQQDGSGTLSWNIRSSTSGTPIITESANQSAWNKDKCDGSGESGFQIDITKTQLYFIDFQWLGVGRVRCGFFNDGIPIIAHEFYHSNYLTTVYIKNPNLPIRCEISSSGGVPGNMIQICNTVMSEGGYVETGYSFAANTGNVGRDCDVGGTRYPIIAVKLKNLFKGLPNRGIIKLEDFSLYTENSSVVWELWDCPSTSALPGASWTDQGTDSIAEYSIFPPTINTTNCIRIATGFNASGNSSGANRTAGLPSLITARRLRLAQNFASNDSEMYVLVVIPTGINLNSNSFNYGGMRWKEVY